jgi:TolA-binding protein
LHGWHHGYWNNWGSWPGIWGTGGGLGWGANNYSYNNPFWNDSYAGAVNYAQPIRTRFTPLPTTGAQLNARPGYGEGSSVAQGGAPSPEDGEAANDSDESPDEATDNGDTADDSEPNDADANEENAEPTAEQKQAIADLDSAREAFRSGDYAGARKLAEKAISLWPEDVIAHEFRALTLFADGKYREAAAGTYAVLAGGPGWDEQTLQEFYPDRQVYAKQLAELKHFAKQHPEAADAAFLLAYHEMVAGRLDEARAQLEHVARLHPNDQLTAELLKALRTPATASIKTATK